MNKQNLKVKIKEAIENNPFRKNIRRVSLFGSYLYGSPRTDSDVDLLIEFSPSAHIGLFGLMAIKEDVERYIGKQVDLLTPESLSQYFKQNVLGQAETVYEG